MLLARKNSLFLCKKFSFCQAKKLTQASTAVSRALKLKEGDKLSGYVVKQVNEIPELHLATVRLQHEATAADHFHVARNDKNNLFSVAFRTTPTNSTGVPHILEHLTLCGSQQFPCRDPFFKMLNRSLATFMNAFTGSDYTMYPFSTQNSKDFENLLRVYLDAVFFPCLKERDFSQEGWRLEYQDINDKNSPIIFKGVVFNEMKGVFSDANQYYAQHLENKLFPSHAYSHVSGGDPFHIPELTWTELKRFHSEHYHPSNSRFFTYGDLPLESHLENIQAFVLSKFSKIRLSNEVIEEKIWEQPREEVIYCQHDPMAAIPEKQTTISVSYLLNPITETYDSFALNILCNLLVDGPNAPFYHSLLESGIGADYSPSYGYSGQTKQSCFSIGLCGIHERDVSQVKEIIESTFDNVIKEGFPSDRIEAVLHSIELLTKHQVSNFGLHAAMAVNAIWNHGGNPINSLKVNDHVQWFRKQMKENPSFLQDKIILHFQNNQHKLMLTMTPSESFKKETEAKEKRLLESKVSVLTAIDKQKIFDEGKELAHYQSKVEDVSCLPTLLIRDVQKVIEKTQMQNVICSDGVSVQLCEQPTNEVVYFKALSTVGNLPEELQKLLPLFSIIVTKMGAGDRDYKQLDQFADLTTGGLNASVHVSENATDCNLFEKGVVFSSFCLEKNLDHMLSLWEDIFTRLLLNDMDRLSRLIKMTAAEMAQGISYQGHILSMIRASSCLSPCADVKEQLSGLSQVTFMKELAEMTDYDAIMGKLSKISSVLLRKDSLRCAINAGPSAMSTSLSRVESFITSLTAGDRIIDENDKVVRNFTAASQHMHFVLPFAVNYLGKSMMTIPFNHEDSASLKTAARLLSSKYLHREIRERGGAYGSGAKLSNGGLFMLYSYRDPNVSQTLENFSSGIEWLLNKEYTDTDIEESKLSVFSEIDKPVSPGHKGMAHFLYSISDDMKQQLRERLFGVTKDDIVAVAEKYLLNSKLCGVSLIGPENEETGRNHKWVIHKE